MLAVPAAPHLEVLRHPRVRAVLSQSSLESVSEALWHGLPLVGLPLRGYDRGACTLAQDSGAALCLLPTGKKAWTQPEVTVAAALKVAGPVPPTTSISSFRAQARRLSAIMQAAGGVPRAADLVELAARVGLAHLQQPRLKMGLGMGSTWLSGSMVDVRLTLFLLLLLSYWALTLAARLARRLVRWAKWYWSAAAKQLQMQQEEEGEGGEGKANGGNGGNQGPAPSPSYQPSPRSSRPGSLSGTPQPQPPMLHASASAPGGLDRHPSSPLSPGYQATVRTNGSSSGSSSSGFRERPPLPPGAGRDR